VVQQRAEAKDCADNPQITLKALSYFEDGNIRDLPQATKDRLAKAARDVDLDHLPVLALRRAST
jgi:hypothetical protein